MIVRNQKSQRYHVDRLLTYLLIVTSKYRMKWTEFLKVLKSLFRYIRNIFHIFWPNSRHKRCNRKWLNGVLLNDEMRPHSPLESHREALREEHCLSGVLTENADVPPDLVYTELYCMFVYALHFYSELC